MNRWNTLAAVWPQLAPTERFLLEGRYFQQRSDRELSDDLGCGANSIRMMMTRARRHVQRLMRREGEDQAAEQQNKIWRQARMRQKMPKNTKLYFSAFLLHFLEICVSCVGIFSHTPQKSRKRQKIKMERFLLVPDSLFYFHLLENGRMKNADGPNYTGETGGSQADMLSLLQQFQPILKKYGRKLWGEDDWRI